MSMNSNSGYWVSDEWRTNPDSLIPGGSVVSVEYHNGEIKMYDKIKKPIHYECNYGKRCGNKINFCRWRNSMAEQLNKLKEYADT